MPNTYRNKTTRVNPDQQVFSQDHRGVLRRAKPRDEYPPTNKPDFKGGCNIDGVEYWITGYIRKMGKPTLQLIFQKRSPVDDKDFLEAKYGSDPPF